MRFLPMVTMLAVIIACASCRNQTERLVTLDADSDLSIQDISGEPGTPTFFGDTTLTIVSSNRPNGYLVKMFITKDMTMLNLSRGDSVNRYIDLGALPQSLCYSHIGQLLDGDDKPAVRGTYMEKIYIPVVDSIHQAINSIAFMDVDFDDEEELIMSSMGYNRHYFTCYDLTGENPRHTLEPMGEPFNQFVSGFEDTYTAFYRKAKTIHIREWIGCSDCIDTWCAFTKDSEYDDPEMHIVKKKEVETWCDGTVSTTIWQRIDGELRQVSQTQKKP